jgi:hypothetical protein
VGFPSLRGDRSDEEAGEVAGGTLVDREGLVGGGDDGGGYDTGMCSDCDRSPAE